MKNLKGKRFGLLFGVIAVVIAINISVLYIVAPTSQAEEVIESVQEEVIEINTTETPQEFTDAVYCYQFAEKKLTEGTCYSRITGYVKGSAFGNVMVDQTMDNTRIIDNDGYRYSTSRSEKQGSLGKNNYQKVAFDSKSENGKVYKMVTDKLNSDGTPNYTNCKWTVLTQSEYKELSGNLPGSMLYNVSPSTVKKIEKFEKLEDGSYHICLLLNNSSSVKGYKKLVKTSAGSFATSLPSFSKVHVECWIDANGNFIKHIMDDTATIQMTLLECTMKSHYEEVFDIVGGNVEQPFEVPFTKQ